MPLSNGLFLSYSKINMAKAGKKQKPGQSNVELPALDDPSLYINRELSLLAFQSRVLEEARDPSNPLLERVKFLSILGSNLDEFFMVRVAGLLNQIESGILDTGPDGLSPSQQLEAVREEYEKLIDEAHACRVTLFAELQERGVAVLDYAELDEAHRESARRYFDEIIYPILTPLAFDPGRPFPHISNLSLNVSVLIRDPEGEEHFARIKVPDTLPQLVPLLGNGRRRSTRPATFVWIEQVIQAHLAALFPGMKIVESHPFHVTRDAEMAIQELEADDLLETIEEGVRQRRFGAIVRLMVPRSMPERLLDILKTNLEIEDSEVYRIEGPLALSRLRHLGGLDRADLRDRPFTPAGAEAAGRGRRPVQPDPARRPVAAPPV